MPGPKHPRSFEASSRSGQFVRADRLYLLKQGPDFAAAR